MDLLDTLPSFVRPFDGPVKILVSDRYKVWLFYLFAIISLVEYPGTEGKLHLDSLVSRFISPFPCIRKG